MNNYMYPFPPSPNPPLYEELKKINKKLDNIEQKLNEIKKKEENKYLEKDDNYYII